MIQSMQIYRTERQEKHQNLILKLINFNIEIKIFSHISNSQPYMIQTCFLTGNKVEISKFNFELIGIPIAMIFIYASNSQTC